MQRVQCMRVSVGARSTYNCAFNITNLQRVQNTAARIVLDTVSVPYPAVALSFPMAACSLPRQLQNSHFNLKGSGT